METLDAYRKLARLGRSSFLARQVAPVLLKHPSPVKPQVVDGPEEWDDKFSFSTRTMEIDPDLGDLIDEEGPIAQEFRVIEVKKQPLNPFPDRIGVGRTKNSDVVLRFPSVSKLHAVILTPSKTQPLFQIMDMGSSNGTFVNDKPLAKAQTHALRSGDRVRLGRIELEFLDPPAFYIFLSS